jgi:hypothetical protein
MKTRFLWSFLLCLVAAARAVEFPGSPPGAAQAGQKNGVYTLQNKSLALSWDTANNELRPAQIVSKLTGKIYSQAGRHVLGVSVPGQAKEVTAKPGDNRIQFYLTDTHVSVAITQQNGSSVSRSFALADFGGKPSLLRAGKMSLHADGTDYPDAGAPGTCRIQGLQADSKDALGYKGVDLGPPIRKSVSARAGTSLESKDNALTIAASANSTAFAEYSLADFKIPASPNFLRLSASVVKDTDKGESWGPGLALIWPNGKFLLANVRWPLGSFSITTDQREELLEGSRDAISSGLQSTAFTREGAPKIVRLEADAKATGAARYGGYAIEVPLVEKQKGIHVAWRAELRDGSHYVRQSFSLRSDSPLDISGLQLADCELPEARQIGSVSGSPVAGSGLFSGIELPTTYNFVDPEGFRTGFACRLTLDKSSPYEFSTVTGVYPDGQMRRAFLAYVERERARSSKPFLHYNCWYDLAQRVNENDLRASIDGIHDQLTAQRGVAIDSYVIDDGWDDSKNSFWGVDKVKFPNGFAPVADQLKKIDSHLGLWISPLGGYGEAPQRIANARKLGLTDGDGLDLSNPAYYKWYRDDCLSLMRDYHVNYFKWDRAGNGVTPHFMALLRVAKELRAANPDVFINVTVGTWPSPFWLNHIDSTWRSGGDMGWTGAGDKREQWLNYRDQEIYRGVVTRAPLYPLNSVMHHGVVLGRYYQGREVAVAGPELQHDARLYFANGASLQELYLTPSLMTARGWDDVAQAAKWAKANADVLADAHWIGGDPGSGAVYGYASWSPRKGIFVLRNPSDKAGEISLDAAQIFELPEGAKRSFALQSPYTDQRVPVRQMRAGEAVKFSLEPFEVLVFEALPR